MYLFRMLAVSRVRRVAGLTGVNSPFFDFLRARLLASGCCLTYKRVFLGMKERWFAGERSPEPVSSKPVPSRPRRG